MTTGRDWKGIAAAIAAIGALATSVAAIVHQPEEVGAERSYIELSNEMTRLSEDVVRTREDLIRLREYVNDSAERRQEGAVYDVVDAGAAPSGAKVVRIHPVAAPVRPPPVSPPTAAYAPAPYSAVLKGL